MAKRKATVRKSRKSSSRGHRLVVAPSIISGVRLPSVHHPRVQEFVPGKLFVRFRPDSLAGLGAAISHLGRSERTQASLAAAAPESITGPMEFLDRSVGIKRVKELFPADREPVRSSSRVPSRYLASVAHSHKAKRDRLRGLVMVEVSERKVSNALIRRVEASPAVEFAERVPNRWLSAAEKPDPEINLQWGLRAIDWFSAERPDAQSIHVGVLDSGIDARHPDLKDAIAKYRHPGGARDMSGHGTHVSGIIAATVNNGIGIAGIANCRLHVWKVFKDPPRGGEEEFDDEFFNDTLNELLDSEVRVVNLSLGGTISSRTERLAFRALIEDGKVIVAAMGNEFEEGNPTEYPAAYEGVLAVGAIKEAKRRAEFSNTGDHIGLVAPGSNVLSTLPTYSFAPERPETDYGAMSGTSMATPHVTGCAALLAAKNPAFSVKELVQRLNSTARRLPAMRGRRFTREYGHGLLDAAKALT